MEKRIQEIFFDFEIIAFELVPLTLAFIEREYLSSGVHMLTNSLKILDTTKAEFFELIFFLNDKKIWHKFCRADLRSVSDTLIDSYDFELMRRILI